MFQSEDLILRKITEIRKAKGITHDVYNPRRWSKNEREYQKRKVEKSRQQA